MTAPAVISSRFVWLMSASAPCRISTGRFSSLRPTATDEGDALDWMEPCGGVLAGSLAVGARPGADHNPSPFVAKVMDVSGAGQFLGLRATVTAD